MSDMLDLIAAGSAIIVEEIGGILSIALTILIFLACVIRYAINIYTYIKDKKITPEELENLKKDTEELIEAGKKTAYTFNELKQIEEGHQAYEDFVKAHQDKDNKKDNKRE